MATRNKKFKMTPEEAEDLKVEIAQIGAMVVLDVSKQTGRPWQEVLETGINEAVEAYKELKGSEEAGVEYKAAVSAWCRKMLAALN